MTKGYTRTVPATMAELKANLRLSGSAFDADLQIKLDSAIEQAGNYIGRDLRLAEVYSLLYDVKMTVRIPNAFNISSVEVNGSPIPKEDWIYDGLTLTIINGTYAGTDAVTVKTEYSPAIRSAIILIASELFTNPVDSVRQLPVSSQMILRPYRRYAGKRG